VAPLLVACLPAPKLTAARAFRLGLSAGVVYFTGTLYWITHVMVVYGGLQTGIAVPVNALLIVYMALFPAMFATVMRWLLATFGPRALMMAPFVWTAAELGRTYVPPGGFPWVLLGYSQATTLPIAQLASLFGVYGVSALVVSVSAASALFVATSSWRDRLVASGSVAAAVALVAVWGSARTAKAEWTREGELLRVGLVQGNVDQAEKWSANRAASIFDDYIRLTRQVIGAGAELVVWPESSTPFMFEEDVAGAERIRALAREAHVPILFGSDQVEWRVTNDRRVPDASYNSAFLVQADGRTVGVYRKLHLVPFGEYVPFRKWLFFAEPLVEAIGTGFAPGGDVTVLSMNEHPLSVAICYEIVYPDLIRQFVRRGSQLLTTITNDAWFGETSAPYQHFAQASMRAVEEGRYLVRSANTGISGIVDPYGRILAQTEIFRPAVVVGAVRLLQVSTLYARTGDAFAYGSATITALAMLAAWRRPG
jgi:apolipoprotein N-acyltransferase